MSTYLIVLISILVCLVVGLLIFLIMQIRSLERSNATLERLSKVFYDALVKTKLDRLELVKLVQESFDEFDATHKPKK